MGKTDRAAGSLARDTLMRKAALNPENAFDEAWLEWFSGCYRITMRSMPDAQRTQIEAAFYAGAMSGHRVAARHGEAVLIAAIQDHLRRQSALPGSDWAYCPRCSMLIAKDKLLDGEACPHCRLVL